jgi:hypothetical protein
MAPKAKELDSVGEENGVPPSIIAQAGAAIAANTPPSQRRPSQTVPRPSQFHENLQDVPGSTSRDIQSGFHTLTYDWITNSLCSPTFSRTSRLEIPSLDIPAPPAYSEKHDQIEIDQDGFDTQAKVTGRFPAERFCAAFRLVIS